MKSRSFAFRRAVLSLLALSVVLFNFASCKIEDDEEYELPSGVYELNSESNLIGTWVNSYSTGTSIYKITSSTFDNSGTSTYTGETTTYDSYAGNNLVVSYTNDDQTAGYIYIEYTRAMNSDYTYSETAPDVGKWYAIAFKELSASSLSLSGAWLEGGVTSTETLEEAISTFTVANGYFDSYSECVKQ